MKNFIFCTVNKFDQLKETVLKYIDILIITETKLDYTFPEAYFFDQFSIVYLIEIGKEVEF